MKKSLLFKITITFTVLYCIICSLSVGSIIYGAYDDQRGLFNFGNKIVYFWMFNSIGLIISIIGLCRKSSKRGYILCKALMIMMWLSGGMAVASIF